MFVLLLVSPAFGQYVSVIQACSRDVTDSCGPAQPGRGPLMECVKAHLQDFTEPCKAALVRIAAVRASCGADIHEQCSAKLRSHLTVHQKSFRRFERTVQGGDRPCSWTQGGSAVSANEVRLKAGCCDIYAKPLS